MQSSQVEPRSEARKTCVVITLLVTSCNHQVQRLSDRPLSYYNT
jgi:hypothetical protein